MDAVWILAMEEAGQFGLNLNLFETNIINLAIVIGILVYFGRGVLGKILGDRQTAIATEVKEAEERKQTAAARLADEQQKLAQAQEEAKRIIREAEIRAKQAKEQILAQAKVEIERLKATAGQDTLAQEERVSLEVRQRIAELALEQVEAELAQRIAPNQSAQQQLIDRSLALLGGN
ncbi:F0F1 ATP synthase subunit B [Synechococcus sp. PCC 6312]|uniref:F0F1 ATP synthase subunit B n=1 Tax=Synechococcus sp. (strain ATCC 27167 / PCC 6312) TaxID=195253 RepID=UPI00029EF793|nr:F0F1 ATP synthase subunit B [Synechococcus sp. PCC 6312]AFY61407.1 F0F1-type ATP synthase, beta subunit [Synechococcus sp. PCC 6312]